jgi:choloylglycine hydrolase
MSHFKFYSATFTLITDYVPGEKILTTLHLSLSDKNGDSAIIEYINGKQVIHHDKKYQVMTNSLSLTNNLHLIVIGNK